MDPTYWIILGTFLLLAAGFFLRRWIVDLYRQAPPHRHRTPVDPDAPGDRIDL